MPEPTTRSLTVPDTQTSPERAKAPTPCADVHSHPRHVVPDHLALPSVHAGTDLDPEGFRPRDYRLGAFDRTRRPFERGEEAVSGRLDLASPVALELSADQGVVALEKPAPAPVPQLGELLG